MIIGDVVNLGAEYVACDPRDKSELVIPMFDDEGQCWGVLDLDSRDRDAFSETDLYELRRILESTGLSWPKPHLDPLCY